MQRDIDVSAERLFLTGCIVSTDFLREVQALYKPELLSAPWARHVADWCALYLNKYQHAPGKHIQQIFEARKPRLPEDQVELIEELLSSLSEEHERGDGTFNVDYALDRVERHFKARSLENLAAGLEDAVLRDRIEEGQSLITKFQAPALPRSMGINPFDERAIHDAYEPKESDTLFKLPGALGKFLGAIVREDFVAILGPEKRGKSFWLYELAYWAARHKRNVALFGIGDMSEKQYVLRVNNHLSRTSHRATKDPIRVPVLDCFHNQLGTCDKRERKGTYAVLFQTESGYRSTPLEDALDHVPCTHCNTESPKEFKGAVWYTEMVVSRPDIDKIKEAGKRFERTVGHNRIKIICMPSGTVRVADVENQLQYWEQYEDWVADVVVLDYADTMGPEEPHESSFRHQENYRWTRLRALAQRRRIAVITATQADAAGHDKATLSERNFSEDKRKLAHVTMMITLNQTPNEKERGIMRIGRFAVRDDGFSTRRTVHVLECRAIGRPHLSSYF